MENTWKLVCITCAFLAQVIAVTALNEAGGDRPTRAAQQHIIELLLVADYSFYSKFYNLTTPSDSEQKRDADAKDNLKRYVSSIIHSTNNAYRSLEPHNISITIEPVQLLIMTQPQDSPWTESIKVLNTTVSKYELDPSRVLDLFVKESRSVHSTIPHDYAMLLTVYQLKNASGTYFNGYAKLSAECLDRGVSVVRDTNFETTLTVAHEMGHSLSCGHDGSDNTCQEGEGYIMEEGTILNSTHKWEFSPCSISDISKYLNKLYHINDDCMLTTNNHHVPSELATMGTKWFGQIYSPDGLCRLRRGDGSNVDRDYYYNNYTAICEDFRCTEPDDADWYTHGLAPDGLPCGNGKWCMQSACTADKTAPDVLDNCPVGDQYGDVKDGRTCQEIVNANPNECNTKLVKRLCCHTCANVHTTPTPFNEQCTNHRGTGSIVCRTAVAYNDKILQDVMCAELHCVDPTKTNSCPLQYADDKTPCGYKKWCIDQKCVHSDQAPSVLDSCPWGDKQGIASTNLNLTCHQLLQPANQRRCYNLYLRKSCCNSCAQIERKTQGCEYGDKQKGCTVQSCPFYNTEERNDCCETCKDAAIGNSSIIGFDDQCANQHGAGSAMCRTASAYSGKVLADVVCSKFMCSDPSRDNWCLITTAFDKTPCGNKKWCIKGVCVHDAHAQPVSDTCIWGDAQGIASRGLTCAQIGLPENQHYCYSNYTKSVCCGTCESVQRNITDCAYGDKMRGCGVKSCPYYSADERTNCCETCHGASSAPSTSPVSFDQQCVNKHGDGSKMCRSATFYNGKNLSSVICSHYSCVDPSDSNYCLTTSAYDRTSCGYKKWCSGGTCIHDDKALDASDTCFWGNVPGIATSGLTCEQLKIPDNQYHCYYSYSRTNCCDACGSIKRSIAGCEYGDKLHGCKHQSCHSYDADTRTKCCETCRATGPDIVG